MVIEKLRGKIFWICFLGSLFIALMLMATGFFGIYQNHLFARRSNLVEGVVRTKGDNSWVGRYGNIHRNGYLSYTYEIDGKRYSSPEILVAHGTFAAANLDGPIPVRYLVSEPAESRIELPAEETANAVRPWYAIFLGCPFLILAVGVWTGRVGNERRFRF